MGSDEVHVAREGGVLTLTLDRPDDQNRLTRDVIATLQDIAALNGAARAGAPSAS